MRFFVFALLVAAAPASAQPSPPAPIGLSDSARVSLLTMVPGDEVYSLWGHNALRIVDPAAGLDRTYNYGTFTFEQPNFVLRFLSGRLDYILGTAPFDLEVAHYRSLGRPIIEQRLDLPPETVRALYDRLEINALPANRAYRYDFLRDNCSTRLIDVLDDALVATGQPRIDLPAPAGGATFRDLVGPYSKGRPIIDLSTNLGLGLPMDRVAEPREAIFLPDALLAAADGATIGDRPLVAERDTLFWVEGAGTVEPAFPWPTVVGWLVLALGLVVTVWGWRKPPSRGARVLDQSLFAVVGVVGLILLLLWVATEHYVTRANLELLWMWPTHLVFALALRRAELVRWRPYAIANAVVTAGVVVVWAGLPEPMHSAVLPLAILVSIRAGARAWGVSPPPAGAISETGEALSTAEA
ncbi:DUF4105 domain-containing protein [Rubrivirga sp. IMCC43871]|uniref:Lnb N-terminal periplasmic domain-containing protein n=1 Tax=Rubrivirga sp. IMCC43871 TaxID=3391575 RepID=UPI0039902AB6